MKSRIYFYFTFFVFLLVAAVFVCHFHIQWLPLACFLAGLLLRIVFKSRYLEIFTFLIPVLPFFARFESRGFPLNYLILPVFFLAGIVAAELVANRGRFSPSLPPLPRFYPFYLLLLATSFLFVMLRWSNLTLSPLAFFRDTPVAPTGQRLSFGIIFPLVELSLFALSPLYWLLLKRAADLRRILTAFLCGQSFSIFYSLFQRWQEKTKWSLPLDGLASDATSFGFLSALALLLAWHLYSRYSKKWLGIIFAVIALIGILNSATRVGLFAVVAALLLLIVFGQKKTATLIVVGILLAGSLMLYFHFFHQPGSNIWTRLKHDFLSIKKSVQLKRIEHVPLVDESDPRNVLWRYSVQCLRDFPVTGVGAGNFVFWVMNSHRGDFLHHLPANQYLFVTSSIGLIGLLAFLFFCFDLFRRKRWPERWLLGTFLFLLVFNDYLWFSEIFLLFWLFAALGQTSEEPQSLGGKKEKWVCLAVFLLFAAFHVMSFAKLHPKNWAQAASTSYDYGFSYPEKEGTRAFRWSGGRAGIYLFLDKDRPTAEYRLACGAPLLHLPGKRQAVRIYWRGKFLKEAIFTENGEIPLVIGDRSHREGFLEFRVEPTFRLKEMGLGTESRTLGVQVSGPGI